MPMLVHEAYENICETYVAPFNDKKRQIYVSIDQKA
jgi:hypothetical protein